MDHLQYGIYLDHVFSCIILILISLFGFLLVASELGYEKILDEFGFLKTFLGRGLFYILYIINIYNNSLAGVVCYAYAAIRSSNMYIYILI